MGDLRAQFRCARLIAQCGELSGEGRRCLVAEDGMVPLCVVDVGPYCRGLAGVVDAKNSVSLSSPSRIRPLKASQCPPCMGFPGAM